MSFRQSIVPRAEAQEPFFLGVDVGGTNIKIGLVDDRGQTLAFESIETRTQAGPEDAFRRAVETCHALCRKAEVRSESVKRCGLGTPGPMCLTRWIVLNPSNLPSWHDFPVRQHLQDALGIVVSYINDANAAAFGEFWVGAGASHDSLALLTLGTGVGGRIDQ